MFWKRWKTRWSWSFFSAHSTSCTQITLLTIPSFFFRVCAQERKALKIFICIDIRIFFSLVFCFLPFTSSNHKRFFLAFAQCCFYSIFVYKPKFSFSVCAEYAYVYLYYQRFMYTYVHSHVFIPTCLIIREIYWNSICVPCGKCIMFDNGTSIPICVVVITFLHADKRKWKVYGERQFQFAMKIFSNTEARMGRVDFDNWSYVNKFFSIWIRDWSCYSHEKAETILVRQSEGGFRISINGTRWESCFIRSLMPCIRRGEKSW